jgi:hypothetical protein
MRNYSHSVTRHLTCDQTICGQSHYITITSPIHRNNIATTSPLHRHYIATTSQQHRNNITITSPLHRHNKHTTSKHVMHVPSTFISLTTLQLREIQPFIILNRFIFINKNIHQSEELFTFSHTNI